jgi:hypothetical protein
MQKRLSRLWGAAIALSAVQILATAAHAQTWRYEYIEASGEGTISTCIASVEYRDAWFSVRFYGDTMDMVFWREDFGLPANRSLGSVIVDFGQAQFAVESSTFSPSYADGDIVKMFFMNPAPSQYSEVLSALRFGNRAEVVFPNGSAYYVDLQGSNRAIEAASDCWAQHYTSGNEVNPFDTPSGANNPFATN